MASFLYTMSSRLSLEIFRDVETPDANTDLVESGVGIVNEVIDGKIDITQSSRKMRISKQGAKAVVASRIRWNASSIDFRVVTTSRPIDDENAFVSGFAMRRPNGGGDAVVSAFHRKELTLATTTAHELGHLFGLKYDGTDSHHCSDSDCIMFYAARTELEEVKIKKKGIASWLERRGYVAPEYSLEEVSPQQDFCNPCAAQLARKSFFLLQHREGKFIPQEWL